MFYLKTGQAKVDLSSVTKKLKVYWNNPRTGGELQIGSIKSIKPGKEINLGNAPNEMDKNWVVLLKKY